MNFRSAEVFGPWRCDSQDSHGPCYSFRVIARRCQLRPSLSSIQFSIKLAVATSL